jgi:uncharacterized membrane protein
MPDPWSLFLSCVFSAIGVGYFIYGKKQQKIVPLLSGIALVGYSYFISNKIAVVLIGIALSLIPAWIR